MKPQRESQKIIDKEVDCSKIVQRHNIKMHKRLFILLNYTLKTVRRKVVLFFIGSIKLIKTVNF